jgi:4-amino-4-deoxy-L-arabinose transferase-like glycosyltransferase
MSRPAAHVTLIFILIAYLVLGTAYALQTPAWQAPDEPAHYNYVKFIAKNRALPVLQMGDYDQAYNEEFTRTPQNIASLSIEPLRYENYAPPLYYLLAAPVYALTDGWITAIRLFSVVLGGALVAVAYLIGAEAYPDQLLFALGGAAFVAFVPQHLAMMSAVNNDSLSELLIALVVLQCMRLFRSKRVSKRALGLLGVTLGLGLLTKATFYYTAIPIAVSALVLCSRRCALRMTHYALVFLPALLMGAVLWIRNLSVYGGLDVMGLARHNAVVVGQPTTAQWLSDYGAGGLVQRFLATTYRSFWGQFGWMSTPMPDREYLLLGALSLAALIGWVWWLIERRNVEVGMRNSVSPQAIILILLFVLTVGGYLYYNLTFVQHQGRYLFPALIPIGLALAIGWWHILERIKGWIARWLSHFRRAWAPWLNQAQLVVFALIFLYLVRLDLVALQRYIVPNLSA